MDRRIEPFATAITVVVAVASVVSSSVQGVYGSSSMMTGPLFPLATRMKWPLDLQLDPSILRVARDDGEVDGVKEERKLQTNGETTTEIVTDGECVDAPFLWLIRNDNNDGAVEGLGVGTIHLPRRFVMTDNEWQSLVNAAEDGCKVWAEFDLNDLAAIQQILSNCPSTSEPTFVADIPDLDLRAEIENIVSEIVNEYTVSNQIQTVEVILSQSPIDLIFNLIAYWNSDNVELRDYYFRNVFNPDAATVGFLDNDLFNLGFETGGLETAEETCAYIQAIQTPTKEEIVNNWELYAEKAQSKLNYAMDEMLDRYQCGDIDAFNEYFSSISFDTFWTDGVEMEAQLAALLDVRNTAMSERMITAMRDSEHIPMFAVGVAHWYAGENSLAALLEQRGYSLERVSDLYDQSLFPDPVCSAASSTNDDEQVAATSLPAPELTSAPTTELASAPTTELTSAPTTEPTSAPAAATDPTAPKPTSAPVRESTEQPTSSPTPEPSSNAMTGIDCRQAVTMFCLTTILCLFAAI